MLLNSVWMIGKNSPALALSSWTTGVCFCAREASSELLSTIAIDGEKIQIDRARVLDVRIQSPPAESRAKSTTAIAPCHFLPAGAEAMTSLAAGAPVGQIDDLALGLASHRPEH